MFEEVFVLPCRDRNATLSVHVEDKGIMHKFMGRVDLPVAKFRLEKVGDVGECRGVWGFGGGGGGAGGMAGFV